MSMRNRRNNNRSRAHKIASTVSTTAGAIKAGADYIKEATNPVTPSNVNRGIVRVNVNVDRDYVSSAQSAIIPDGFGLTLPAFRSHDSNDETSYMPFGVVFGYYLPMGQESAEYYPTVANSFANTISASIKHAGYAVTFTNANVRAYMNGVAELLQMQIFVKDLRTLLQYRSIHTAIPIGSVLNQALTPKLIQAQEILTQTLKAIPFPTQFVETYRNGFGITTTSDSPFGMIRTFAPKAFQVSGTQLSGDTMATAIHTAIADFFAVSENKQLSVLMPFPGIDLPVVGDSHVKFNNNTINNIANLPYFDGTGSDPSVGDDTATQIYYRRSLTPYGLLTFAPDDSIVTTPQGTVWAQNIGAESTATKFFVTNNGTFTDIYTDANTAVIFGTVWENTVGVTPGENASTAYVKGTFSGVAKGVAKLMFNY